jgi:hypothetical protein
VTFPSGIRSRYAYLMPVVTREPNESFKGYVGAAFDRGVARVVERTVEAMRNGHALEPLEALTGVLDLVKHRPERVHSLGRQPDATFVKNRLAYRADLERAEARREREREELEELMQAA